MTDDLDAGFDRAFTAFDASDVSVDNALLHAHRELPHEHLLALRGALTAEAVAEARGLVAPLQSAWLTEAFVARPLEAIGLHGEALRERLALLAYTPRWESLISHVVLTGVARSALALGRGELATRAAERALRFDPVDPRCLEVLSRAYSASKRETEAAAVRAHLWDQGYGPSVIPGAPGDADRAATAYAPDLSVLEPMSLEDRARYAVFSLHDSGAGDSLTAVARHAITLLRCGWVAQAWAHLYALRSWRKSSATLMSWLGLHLEDDARDQARRVLFDAIERLPAGAQAASAARKQAPNPAGVFESTRVEGVAVADPARVEPALLDGFVEVRLAARTRLAEHPLVLRAAEIEAGLAGFAPLYHGPDLRFGSGQQHLVGVWAPGWVPGIAPASTLLHKAIYAQLKRDLGPFVPHSFLTHARAPKPSCSACKKPFEKGELQLRMREGWAHLDEAKPFHLRCAAKPAPKRALAEASSRWRGPLRAAVLDGRD